MEKNIGVSDCPRRRDVIPEEMRQDAAKMDGDDALGGGQWEGGRKQMRRLIWKIYHGWLVVAGCRALIHVLGAGPSFKDLAGGAVGLLSGVGGVHFSA